VTAVHRAVLGADQAHHLHVRLAVRESLTDLLKVRQGVKIAQADVQIARAEVEKGIRDLVSGVE
jgi:hypothetical protein